MKEDFYKYQAQTTPHPLALEISHAEGSYIYDTSGKKHLDFVAGVSACTLGHCHPRVVSAIKNQSEKYLHVMVYGEYIQQPAVELTKLLSANLPKNLNTTYLVNSGTEAIEGALKLARRATGRTQILYAYNAYHGNTMGAMSVMGFEERKNAFKPLVPNCFPITFNDEADIQKITSETAAIILETIQGGAGFIQPENGYLKKVRKRCDETGTLLILDEIQPGFGRTGKLFAFEHFDAEPDILVMGKGMGGGLPIGAFTASHQVMAFLKDNPKLGHITTFGGNPLIAAAALATLRELTETQIVQQTLEKEKLFRKLLKHPLIKEVRGRGLMLAAMMETPEIASEVILACKEEGLILFWLLFEGRALRITPPLTISDEEIAEGCRLLQNVLNRLKTD
ncbi:aminotransferase class III-fold pyridoxal phosphate-dependent enzyme [Aequorivita sp. SDUM287046]|uniref:Aminotransferase class III-fold pyridoxal phosphate-dependent enzyme n=1 Tax=Aequorivita aurantiaca TaxID=3053356 RepID=A0ABT8DM26_9FLAO|nr:aminotransferase class III-fold pyridoxal phosphate-dependent enzyme [Aequorivita aurantiaca]MDN3725031.1 aminotransferase class III-fold pyridoxal phosphate-dependent enzyme [Aequorivita aurantiaca]